MAFIVVQHYQFPIREPFAAGHVLTAIEANVLNWHRARLIQKIVTRWVTEAQATRNAACEDDILSITELDALTERIRQFDEAYKLQASKEPRTSILEYNLDLLAENFLYRNGHSDPRKEDIERIKRTPEIQERAREIIRSGTFSLDELIA